MDASRIERIISLLYISSAVLSLTSLICLVTVWQYWTSIVNFCINVDCGCILYARSSFNSFMGGEVILCHFGVYGMIPPLIFGLCLGGYHGYRCCIHKNLDAPVQVTSRNLETDDGPAVVVRPKRRAPCKQWTLASFLTILLFFLSLTHAIITTDGYYKTCEQYRKRLIQVLNSAGRETEVIHDRLSCGAMFDFMDYLQSDPDTFEYKKIDTGFALRLAIVSSWLNCCAWILAFSLNVIAARKRFCCWTLQIDPPEDDAGAIALASIRSRHQTE
ncbi:uncharacterized protein LOC108623678 [Ceratina calcarata]|uniref:Uncharacterized protein LOC108623669 n=1 Tax=Ceratina calcarata TaxID=156304 RepID=A0AAJ7IVW0_9HYME|nr:uncharacterized protein LOC108623669 [Ceratina calcarata]XP_017877847.1 uncharacterized protein LOC108623678 [Ceratina calcarata]